MAFNLPEAQLEETERELGARFPESYRTRMMASNGGALDVDGDDWEIIPIRDTSDRKRLARTANHVIHETAIFAQWRTWHENAFAIARNGMGDALVLFRDGSSFEPWVAIWRHETGGLEVVAGDYGELRYA